MHDSAGRWFIVENAKIFWSYVKNFWIFPSEKDCRILLVYANKFSWIIQSCLLHETIKRS